MKNKKGFSISRVFLAIAHNLWIVVNEKAKELNEFMCNTPYHQDIVNYWNENKETDTIKKAARFLYLTNYVFMGKGTI